MRDLVPTGTLDGALERAGLVDQAIEARQRDAFRVDQRQQRIAVKDAVSQIAATASISIMKSECPLCAKADIAARVTIRSPRRR
jgi:hypothetical protein